MHTHTYTHTHIQTSTNYTFGNVWKTFFCSVRNKSGKNSNEFVRETYMPIHIVIHRMFTAEQWSNKYGQCIKIDILVNSTTNRMAKWTRHIDVCSCISSMVVLVCPMPRYRFLHFERRKTDTPYVICKVLWKWKWNCNANKKNVVEIIDFDICESNCSNIHDTYGECVLLGKHVARIQNRVCKEYTQKKLLHACIQTCLTLEIRCDRYLFVSISIHYIYRFIQLLTLYTELRISIDFVLYKW